MHILLFRNEDNCPWVAREVRRFAVDCVAAQPTMKLEYIALGSTVERLVRRARKPKPLKAQDKSDVKGKGKEVAGVEKADKNPLGLVSLDQLMMMGGGKKVEEPSSEESEGEDEDDGREWDGDRGPGMRLETLEGVSFFDVPDVRMWRKDVLGGWL